MNQAAEILSRYGLAMQNLDYEKEMFKQMERMEGFVMRSVAKDGQEAVRNENILRAFGWQTDGIYVENLDVLRERLALEKEPAHISGFMLEMLQVYIYTQDLEKPFHFSMRSEKNAKKFIKKKLKQNDSRLTDLLDSYRLRQAFVPDEAPKEIYFELLNQFYPIAEKLNKTQMKAELDKELSLFLWERFAQSKECVG